MRKWKTDRGARLLSELKKAQLSFSNIKATRWTGLPQSIYATFSRRWGLWFSFSRLRDSVTSLFYPSFHKVVDGRWYYIKELATARDGWVRDSNLRGEMSLTLFKYKPTCDACPTERATKAEVERYRLFMWESK